MGFIACIVPIILNGYPDIAAMSGRLLQSDAKYYTADFSNAASGIQGIQGKYDKVKVEKIDCVNTENL